MPNFYLNLNRFATVSEEDKDELLKEKDPINTRRSTASGIKTLNDYLTEKLGKTLEDIG